jgi:hypothetical protein
MRLIYGELMSDQNIVALLLHLKRDWPPPPGFEEDPLVRSARAVAFDEMFDRIYPPVLRLDGCESERVHCPACGNVGYRHHDRVVHVWHPVAEPTTINQLCRLDEEGDTNAHRYNPASPTP